MNISVLGCGRWGSLIAWYLDKIGHNVFIFGRRGSKNIERLKLEGKNDFLSLSKSVKTTSDLEKAINTSEIIIISISCQNLRAFMQDISQFQIKNKIIVLCMKGIEENTGKRLSEIVNDYITYETKVAIWVGPGHVQSLVEGIPNCMVIDSREPEVKNFLVKQFTSNLIRFYYGSDLIGNEIGAAAKNVMGIAAGVLDGLKLEPLKGALMSRGAREISKLIKAMGGNEMSAYGLCHLGDYQATLFSSHSNNLEFGRSLINGGKYHKLAEGVSTSKALTLLSKLYDIELPICTTVNNLIVGTLDVGTAMSDLFLRNIKNEF